MKKKIKIKNNVYSLLTYKNLLPKYVYPYTISGKKS